MPVTVGCVSARPRGGADLQQQLEPVIEVLVVALQVLSKERERLQVGAASNGNFGSSGANEIQRREVLES